MANRLTPAIIVLISGNYAEEEVERDLQRNHEKKADYFLKKPLKFEEFCTVLYKLIEKRI